ncbi:MAG TPA: hypothetical protein VGO56_07650 [Pyrinomonadaceae bacterium]|jgi:hypothetical protein|nr:hypothetical protein [Pyrinomonadaceae bacterium]
MQPIVIFKTDIKWSKEWIMFLHRAIIFVLLVFLCSSAFAQRPGPQFRRPLACEPVEPRTKLEAIEWQYERVLIKGFSQIATFTARDVEVRIDAVELKDTASATRAIGLVIALKEAGENPHENRAFIDYEEIPKLLEAMTSIGRVNESVTKLASFEARYRTLGDLELIVFRQSRSGVAASVTAGICDRVTAPLSLDDLDRLKAHIVEAKTRLDEIK